MVEKASGKVVSFPLPHEKPKLTGDGNNGDGRLEARVAKLEASVAHIERDIGEMKTDVRGLRSDARTDFRLLFGALIAVALGLAGMMARGFGWL